jgi:hypothetical protein
LIHRLYSILPQRLRNLNDKYKAAINALYLIAEGRRMDIGKGKAENTAMRPKSDFFTPMTIGEARAVFSETKAFEAGQAIFAEGDRGDGAYLILEGKAKAVVMSDDNEKIVLGEFGRGEIFGEMALIDNKPRSAGVVTITPCTCAFIGRKSFSKYIETRSDLAFRLKAFICLSLFQRIITLDQEYVRLTDLIRACFQKKVG